jgi:hypothetical protein
VTARHWYEDRRTIGRWEDRGLDHGSAGRLLAEVRRGNETVSRLVWYAGHKTPVCGIRGFGHQYVPAHLALTDGRGYSKGTLFEGGRVTAARLSEHAARIDAELGDGATALIDPTRTLVVVRSPEGVENEEGEED